MAVLRNAINAIDPAPDKAKDLTLALSLLSELCEQHVNRFKAYIEDDIRTAGIGDNRSIPVREIMTKHDEYRAYVKADSGKVATEVAAAIKEFVAGGTEEIISGMARMVTTALEAIIGAGEGGQQESKTYYIIAQDYAVVRYDICAWSRKIAAAGLTQHIENVLAIVAYKSSVDLAKISLNTFLVAYGSQLTSMKFPPEKIAEYIQFAEKIYRRLSGGEAANDAAAPLALAQGGGSAEARVPHFILPGESRGSRG